MADPVVVLDAGPLYAAADASDRDHRACVAALLQPRIRLVIPALVVSEVSYLIGARLGAEAEARFLASLEHLEVRAPEPEDWPRISALVHRYRDLPLGGTDASVVVLAERLRTTRLMTLDHRHFSVVRTAIGNPFELIP